MQEEDDEEDLSSCSGREELAAPHCSLNRRGSRSEGKLNVTVQERIAESERRRDHKPPSPALKHALKSTLVERIATKRLENNKNTDDASKSPINRPHIVNSTSKTIFELDSLKSKSPVIFDIDNKMPNSISLNTSPMYPPNVVNHEPVISSSKSHEKSGNKRPASAIEPHNSSVVTTIITEASTITIPIHTTSKLSAQILPKYKTMPSPTRNNPTITLCPPQLTLNEIFEEGDTQATRQFASRSQARTNYEQRKSKFKNRTASCSSSDASDDDSESRKKRAHKLNNNGKPLPRRDSHDDSSDSQEPGGGTGGGASQDHVSGGGVSQGHISETNQYTQNKTTDNRNGNNTGGRKNCDGGKENNVSLGRRHRTGRRRTGETRLRESQSLNRISEVQEDVHNNSNLVITVTAQSAPPPKQRSIGSKLLSWKKSFVEDAKSPEIEEKIEKDKTLTEKSSRKMRLLGKYFQVHKKIWIPLPGFFTRNRLHKTQSCSSLVHNGINIDAGLVKNDLIKGNETKKSDMNRNVGWKSAGSARSGTVVQLNTVCSGIGVCTLHLGDASKCCSLC